MERIAFTMRVKPGQEQEYRRRHEAVWPAMLEALKAAGCRNYSIYMKGQDLFAYMEVEDFQAFLRYLCQHYPSRPIWLLLDKAPDPGSAARLTIPQITAALRRHAATDPRIRLA